MEYKIGDKGVYKSFNDLIPCEIIEIKQKSGKTMLKIKHTPPYIYYRCAKIQTIAVSTFTKI